MKEHVSESYLLIIFNMLVKIQPPRGNNQSSWLETNEAETSDEIKSLKVITTLIQPTSLWHNKVRVVECWPVLLLMIKLLYLLWWAEYYKNNSGDHEHVSPPPPINTFKMIENKDIFVLDYISEHTFLYLYFYFSQSYNHKRYFLGVLQIISTLSLAMAHKCYYTLTLWLRQQKQKNTKLWSSQSSCLIKTSSDNLLKEKTVSYLPEFYFSIMKQVSTVSMLNNKQ